MLYNYVYMLYVYMCKDIFLTVINTDHFRNTYHIHLFSCLPHGVQTFIYILGINFIRTVCLHDLLVIVSVNGQF